MTNIMCDVVKNPPLTRYFTETDINQSKLFYFAYWLRFKTSPLQLKHPCHNQAFEQNIELISKALSTVATIERRYGLKEILL